MLLEWAGIEGGWHLSRTHGHVEGPLTASMVLILGGSLKRSLLEIRWRFLRVKAGIRLLLRRASIRVILLCLWLSEYSRRWWGHPTLMHCHWGACGQVSRR